MSIQRRTFLAGSAAALAAPALAQSSNNNRLLRFIPQADLAVLDPMWTTAYVTRNHGFMVFDTLFGVDSQYRPSPQMLAGFNTEDEGKLWTLGLRTGLKFHDGEPVRAQDCVASHQSLEQARRVRRRADGGDRRIVGQGRPHHRVPAEAAASRCCRRRWPRRPDSTR